MFNEYEISVRKQWLISFIITCIAGILMLFFEPKDPMAIARTQSWLSTELIIKISIFAGIVGALFAFASYYFAYKKQGTKWLLYILITIALAHILNLISTALAHILNIEKLTSTPLISWTTFRLLVNIYFWISCYRLYSVNKARAKKVSCHQPDDAA